MWGKLSAFFRRLFGGRPAPVTADVPVLVVTVPPAAPPSSDVTAPSIPVWVSQGAVSGGTSLLTFDRPTDPYVTTSGLMAAVEIYKNGVYVDEVAYAGTSGTYSVVNVGATGGAVIQSGCNYSVTSSGTEIYGTADSFSGAAFAVTGAVTVTAKLPSYTSPWDYDKKEIQIRESSATGSKVASFVLFPSAQARGGSVDGRSATNGSMTQPATTTATSGYVRMVHDLTTTSVYLSTTGTDQGTLLGTFNPGISAPTYYVVLCGSNVAGAVKTFEFENVSIQPSGTLTYNLTCVAGDVVTLKSRDAAGLRSAASPSVTLAATPVVSGTHAYPRIGGGFIGEPQNYPNWSELAKHDFLILGGDNEGFVSAYGSNYLQARDDGIKAINPNCVIWQYVLWDTYKPTHDRYPVWDAIVEANPTWILRTTWSGGSLVPNFYATTPQGYQVNPFVTTTANSDGHHAPGAFAKYAINRLYGTGSGKSNRLDGFLFDNCLWKPRSDGDYTRDGSSDSQNTAAIQTGWRTGLLEMFTVARTINSSLEYGGNIADWPNAGGYSFNLADISPMNQATDGSFGEYLKGTAGVAFYEWGGSTLGRNSYRYQINGTRGNKRVMFVHCDLAANGTDPAHPSLAAYQKMRSGLAECLLDIGYYFGARSNSYRSDQVNWFDEYWGGSLNTRGYLGNRVGSPPSAAYSGGVWVAEFDNGYAISWPEGVTSSITLPVNVHRLTGTQAPTVNTGATHTAGSAISPPGGTAPNGLIVLK